MKAFISYSHKDEWALDRLHTHLAVLRREGAIDAWFDQKILAGGQFDAEISDKLDECEVFIALVSPDFLASNYCVEIEMQRAEQLHTDARLTIVPIIIDDCEWKQTSLGSYKALPKDGKPIRNWTNENTAFLDVVNEVRRLIATGSAARMRADNTPIPNQEASTSPSRYRVARTFDQIDRRDFLESAYGTVSAYFRRAIEEIDTVDGVRARYSKINERSFTAVIANQMRDRVTGAITVHVRTGDTSVGDIYFSQQEGSAPGTAQGAFNIDADDFDLYFKGGSFGFGARETADRMDATDVAKELWHILLQDAEISYG